LKGLRYVRIFVRKNSGKRSRQKVKIILSHYLLAKNGKAPKVNDKFVEGIGKLGIGTVLSSTHWMV